MSSENKMDLSLLWFVLIFCFGLGTIIGGVFTLNNHSYSWSFFISQSLGCSCLFLFISSICFGMGLAMLGAFDLGVITMIGGGIILGLAMKFCS